MGATVRQKATPQHKGVSFNHSAGELEPCGGSRLLLDSIYLEIADRRGKEVVLLVRSWCGEGEEYEGHGETL